MLASLSNTKLLTYQYFRCGYGMFTYKACINPTFDCGLALSNRFLIGFAMGAASRKFSYCNNIHLIFFAPLNNHSVMLVLIVHSCISICIPKLFFCVSDRLSYDTVLRSDVIFGL